jgi:hypothetical protein
LYYCSGSDDSDGSDDEDALEELKAAANKKRKSRDDNGMIVWYILRI